MIATAEPQPGTQPQPARASGRRAGILLGVDLVLPIGMYYGLRAFGLSSYAALLVSALVPLVSAAVQFRRDRRLDGMAAFVAGVMLLGLAASLFSGSTRFMLVKDGWVTGAAGLWFLGTVWARRPLAFEGARPLLEGRFRSDGTSWDVLWERSARFRRIWRVSTAIWGVAMVLDGVIRVVMAYTLPVDAVPGLNGLLWPVTLVLLQVVNGVYYEVAGLWRITRPEGPEGPADSAGSADEEPPEAQASADPLAVTGRGRVGDGGLD